MLGVAVANLAVCVGLVFWYRALSRSRGPWIPCVRMHMTGPPTMFTLVSSVPILMIVISVFVLVGWVTANALLLKAMGQLGKHINGGMFVLWMGSMTAAAILGIVCITARYTNRTAPFWFRTGENEIFLREREGVERPITIRERSVRMTRYFGPGGIVYVCYELPDGDGSLTIASPISLPASMKLKDAPIVQSITALVVQGGPNSHAFFQRFV